MAAPSERFDALLKSVRAEITAIDVDTPWSESEPRWWLDMMKLERLVIDLQDDECVSYGRTGQAMER